MKKSLSANKTRHAAWRLCPSDENTKYLQVPWQVPALPRRLTGGEGGATPSWNDTFGTGREPHLKGRCHTAASEAPGRLQGSSRAGPDGQMAPDRVLSDLTQPSNSTTRAVTGLSSFALSAARARATAVGSHTLCHL